MKRLKCPCCEYFTVESDDEAIVDICEVCFWQYDIVAHKFPERNIGANHVSLSEARENFKKYGACKKEFKHLVRETLKEEHPKNN
ncbi:CPCC family cysteine-rich protein [Paenibacillus sp. NPDC057934]|uniref:CPCC family cysteine-rich protein n=1 Tax=Paenibacillus sp. NPDC057934 TaxID=3346282 RepID=UPI0036D8D211